MTGGASPVIVRNASVVVEADRINQVCKDEDITSAGEFDKVIDAGGKVVCPGFVNAHTHMLQCLLRGWGDDLELHQWIESVLYLVADVLTVEDLKAAAALACVEMIRTGVTCVVENQNIATSEEMVDATASMINEAGIRGVIARGVRQRTGAYEGSKAPETLFQYSVDEEVRLTETLIRKCNSQNKGKVSVCPGPVSMAAATDELLVACHDLATKYRVPVHIHVAESKRMTELSSENHGCTEVERLERLGVLDGLTHIVHGVWLTSRDTVLLAQRKSSLIHCPVSNMYLASGVAPVVDCYRSGINVALGTDGPASNNSHDMFEVLKTSVLLQKVSALDPLAMRSYDAFTMSNWNGAKALNMDSEFGQISPGKKADLIILNLDRPFTAPVRDPISTIVYSARADNVETVIVDGQLVMESRRVLTIDEDAAVHKANERSRQLLARVNMP